LGQKTGNIYLAILCR